MVSLSVPFIYPPSIMEEVYPHIDDFVLSFVINYLVESADVCSLHHMPSVNTCMNICKRSTSERWKVIWLHQWFIHFYFDWFLRVFWHCVSFFFPLELSCSLGVLPLSVYSSHWWKINLSEILLWFLPAQCPSVTSN